MFREIQNEKIGNMLIYLADKIDKPLYKTKALKLLYIIDEIAIKETGVPVTWLDYKAWKFGPVAEDIYNDVEHIENSTLNNFIVVEKEISTFSEENDTKIIKPKKLFDNSKFNNYEMKLIDKVIKKYGKLTAKKLVNLLHKEGSLWHKEVSKLELSFRLHNGKSNHVLELSNLLENDETKQFTYQTAFEALQFQQDLLNN